jgi:23S rRNA (pseudouridine1915-N3)-methyltransferase
MKIKIICVGKIKDHYLRASIADFSDRVGHYKEIAKVETVEIKDMGIEKEADKIIYMLDEEFLVVLGEEGKSYSSGEFADFIKKMNKDIVFVIGGPFGVSQRLKQKANLMLSMSKMTFTHEMARLFLLEQLYRAFNIIKGTQYHK